MAKSYALQPNNCATSGGAQSPDSLLQRSKTQLPLLPTCPRSAYGGYVWVSMSEFMFDSSTTTICHSMNGFQ